MFSKEQAVAVVIKRLGLLSHDDNIKQGPTNGIVRHQGWVLAEEELDEDEEEIRRYNAMLEEEIEEAGPHDQTCDVHKHRSKREQVVKSISDQNGIVTAISVPGDPRENGDLGSGSLDKDVLVTIDMAEAPWRAPDGGTDGQSNSSSDEEGIVVVNGRNHHVGEVYRGWRDAQAGATRPYIWT